MRIVILSVFILGFWATQAIAQVRYEVDLTQIENDQVPVTYYPPKIGGNEAVMAFPFSVPGTYSQLDYGRLITDVHAYDAQGRELVITRQGENSFKVVDPGGIHHITYRVNDSYDAGLKQNPIFEPAGTDIEASQRVLVNGGAFFPYFPGQEAVPVSVTYKHPTQWYVSTALPAQRGSGATTLRAASYHELVDSPALIAEPDTASFRVLNTRVEVAVYSPRGLKYAQPITEQLKKELDAVAKFLGGTLPVSQYNFLVYLGDFSDVGKLLADDKVGLGDALKLSKQLKGQAFGALEHNRSSCYYLADMGLPEADNIAYVNESIGETAVHEFLHILTPLSLRSELIEKFNYLTPRWSRHLWLYEGVTQYHAILARFQGGLMSFQQLRLELGRALDDAQDFPLDKYTPAVLSETVINPEVQKYYTQVYTYGALLALCLDAEIMRLSQGRQTLKTVMLDMIKEYGPDTSFTEAGLYEEFTSRVRPELAQFFEKYVEGNERIDVGAALQQVGLTYAVRREGEFPLSFLEKDIKLAPLALNYLRVTSVGKKSVIPLQVGDRIPRTFMDGWSQDKRYRFLPAGTEIQVPVLRGEQRLTVPYLLQYAKDTRPHWIDFSPQPDDVQRRLFKVWSGGQELL